MEKIAYVGVDYHVDFLSIAVMIEGEKKIFDTIRLVNKDKVITKYFKKLAREFAIRACYEASGSGYVFQRKMASWGYHCDVIAPALVPKKAGDRRKNDFRDALNLVRNYASGMLSIVHPPTEQQEAVRSLIRCRTALKHSAKRVKYQINGLLLGQGLRYPGSKWTLAHRSWLSHLQLPDSHMQLALQEYVELLSYLETRVAYLDEEIERIASSELYAPSVRKLRAFKGIGTLGAMVLIAEITDFRRFASPRALMAFLGLIPSENSSGNKRVGGSITKSGNRRCRTQLIEAAQHYKRGSRVTMTMKSNLSQVDGSTASTAVKCLQRLNKRYWALTSRGKLHPVAITAIARELVGFLWAVMQSEPVAAAA